VRPEALGEHPGTASFHDTGDPMSNANSLVVGPRTQQSYDVPVATVDQVVGAAADREVSCLKIDVEGAELQVLRGAVETIRRWRPAIAAELHPGPLGEGGLLEVWEVLAGHGYDIAVEGRPVTSDWFVAQRHGFEAACLARAV
jgi:hypothetical protein